MSSPVAKDEEKYDFKSLAAACPEVLNPHLKEGADGPYVDLTNPVSSGAVVQAWMHVTHGLRWNLKPGTLCPPVHNRKKYVEWIHLLLSADPSVDMSHPCDVRGVDIGTGASVVYPLLAHKMYGWTMCATEIDPDSAAHALGILKDNNIDQEHIQVVVVPEEAAKQHKVLEGALPAGKTFAFCMCNPPFYDAKEDDGSEKIVKKRRKHGNRVGAITASENATAGGELAFIEQLLEESLSLGPAVKWYTTMFGRKQSVAAFRLKLNTLSLAGVISFRLTSFALGTTTRWLVAWTVLRPTITKSPEATSVASEDETPDAESFASTPSLVADDAPYDSGGDA
ncbi:Ribosomal RNA large subunit methyltransferase F [Diplonema papillatum]|nr:Ribosomal RNA large subunit methyltransferase F [Diplonema papillatum]|eukprot:gene20910-32265_t